MLIRQTYAQSYIEDILKALHKELTYRLREHSHHRSANDEKKNR
ncbi:hypothetical protein HanPSC8_Chr13g0548781 [Helianthus annuus]|nr:hypothetical protein HanPSC8_Chr13g0548781 [Helianthus annuus]